jgi:ElaB/YqjD/DUF883 family membrane-anchored ribosome-binding protein
VTADPHLAGELKSLHEELSASREEGTAPTADDSQSNHDKPQKNAEQSRLEAELHQFTKSIADLLEGAQKEVTGHPQATMLGALIAGILIGRLLSRRHRGST